MIRRLRERHRWMVPLIALLTIIAFAAALIGRRPAAPGAIPPALRGHAESR